MVPSNLECQFLEFAEQLHAFDSLGDKTSGDHQSNVPEGSSRSEV